MCLTRLASLALGLAAAGSASAVNLSQNGMGQVLIYPYYTVNAGQQTLLTIVNTSEVGKVVKVRLREAYNGREVLDFNVFLSPDDVWTANVFSLADAGLAGSGAAIFTADNSCMAPQLTQGPLANGVHYQQFLDYAYIGSNADSGPAGDGRTREGSFEVFAMSDIVNGSALADDIQHVNGVPPRCAQAETHLESGSSTVAPTSGLFGSASIVNVSDGTFFAYNAVALDGFTAHRLDSPTGSLAPDLSDVNDPCCTDGVTARQFVAGQTIATVFPAGRAIDAVSAVFAADALYNEYAVAADASVGTDWVVAFPTKQFYVDAALYPLGAASQPATLAPFEHLFGARESGNGDGLSCVTAIAHVFNREEGTTDPIPCGFTCPPPPPPPRLCRQTNVLSFAPQSVLGSQLAERLDTHLRDFTSGMMRISLAADNAGHDITSSSNGNQFHGLPAIGFSVSRYVNGNVPLTGGGSALANYSAAYPHRWTTRCTVGTEPCS
jgi:hypothetical protein